jgi:hypothetical protein
MKRFRTVPQVEELGSRVLPSAIALARPPEPLVPIVPSPIPVVFKHPLAGMGSGVYSSFPIPTDAGLVRHLHGSAHLAALGEVMVGGTVTGVGFTAEGRATGTLTFIGNGGTVTVELQGPVQSGFSPLPHYFHYQVVQATGAYAHLSDSGTLRLDFHPLPLGAMGERGTFSLWI